MRRAFHHRKLVAWLGILAVLVAALAPSASRALANNRGLPAALMALCTAQGIKVVDTGDARGKQAPAEHQRSRLEHCPLCLLQAAGAAPLPATTPIVAPPSGEPVAPAAFLFAARPQFAWGPIRARGPPSLS